MKIYQSKIEKLIAELCPNGVQLKELGEIADYSKTRIEALELNNANYVGVDNLLPNKQGKTLSNYVPTSGKLTRFESGDILIGNIRPYLKKIWRATHHGGTNGDVLVIRINESYESIISSEFLYYVLSSDSFFVFNMKFSKGAKMPRGNKSAIKKFKVPFPPLAIQEEIVKILNSFTELEAGLEAGLEARKKQYKYYLNSFYNIKGVNYKSLGEIGTFIRGRRFVKTDIVQEGVPCIHYGEMYTHYNVWTKEAKSFLKPDLAARLRTAHYGDVIIVAAGETIEDIGNGVAWLGKSDVVIHDACFAFSHQLNPKYVSYFLQTDSFRSQIKQFISSGKISAINAKGLEKAIIPVPTTVVQEKIVSTLDSFNALIRDISVGIPAELKARRSQYEFYRSKLLTFKEYVH